MFAREQQAVNAFHQIRDVTKRTGLRAVAVDGDRFAAQPLADEVRQGAAIFNGHARAVGVKDAHHARVDSMGAVIGHDQGFGVALGFIVTAAQAGAADVAPVVFRLGMNQRIAVHFAGGCHQEARVFVLRQTQADFHIAATGVQRFNRKILVMHRTRRRCEVHDIIHVAK